MPYLIDSHCHLHDPEFFSSAQQSEFLKASTDSGVLQIICIGTSHADSLVAKTFAEAHENVFWTYGIHPEETTAGGRDLRPAKETLAQAPYLVAVGEIGLDYHYPDFNKQAQWSLLEEMLSLAVELDLPCSFHVRDALPDFFSIVENFPRLKPSVLHSFTDSKANLETALNRGFFIGVNGIATFANLDCYKSLDPSFLDRAVLETDAPFLTPAPKRGIINQPAYVNHIANWLSKKLGVQSDLVAEKTTNNVKSIFNLPNSRSGA